MHSWRVVLFSVRQRQTERGERGEGVEDCFSDWQQQGIRGKMTMTCVFLLLLSLDLKHANSSFTLLKLSGGDEQKARDFFVCHGWASERARQTVRREGGEYKRDAYVSDMMANKKWVLVRVSTGATLPQPNENWLSMEKQWQIKWAIKGTAQGRKRQSKHFPDGIRIIALNL